MPEPVIGFFHLPEGAAAVVGPPSPRDLPRLCHVRGWDRLWLHQGADALEIVCPKPEFWCHRVSLETLPQPP